MERSFQDVSDTTPKKENTLFGEVMGERIIWALRARYMGTCIYGQVYENIMSLEHLLTHIHIHRFIRIPLVPKITQTQARLQEP